ncbi:hypothetical protein AMATHDRAFT_69824 [Amanita thiersii Skay4041]|uniref:SPX domain-containing protein n=1 Tax=Amanita thiersii Skay4041 TaxID=703135 RepID=A0A2A9NFH1_9AGAR|nr:hypothetical protein AMATHDRAFT_69824 [Amanita thiersii Skay4041]
MKFSSSLKFNAVSDWWDEYIAYDTLKKCIYQLEKQQYSHQVQFPQQRAAVAAYRDETEHDLEANEQSALLGPSQPTQTGMTVAEADATFIPFLDRELRKICAFYQTQESEMFEDVKDIEAAVEKLDEAGVDEDGYYGYDDDDDDDDDDSLSRSPVRRRAMRSRSLSLGRTLQARGAGSTGNGAQQPQTQPLSQAADQIHRRYSIASVDNNADLEDTPIRPRPRYLSQQTRSPPIPSFRQIAGRSLSQSLTLLPPSKTRGGAVSSGGPSGAIDRFTGALRDLKDSITSGSGGPGPAPGRDGSSTVDDLVGSGEYSIWNSNTDYAYDTRLLFKRRITKVYIALTNLRSYVELNYSGFRKIIKKYDKVVGSELQSHYLQNVVQPSYPFTQTTKDNLNSVIDSLIALYAKCVTYNDHARAKAQLRTFQREQIAWERDTVWRLMIGRERRGEVGDIGASAELGLGLGLLGASEGGGMGGIAGGSVMDVDEAIGGGGATLVRVRTPEPGLVEIPLPVRVFGRSRSSGAKRRIKITKRRVWAGLAVGLLVGLLKRGVIRDVDGVVKEEANACFAVLMFCTVLWASEAIPLFVTSLFVPLLLVVLRVIKDDDGARLSTPDATKFVFSVIFSPTIMLLIGGFTISSALSKTNIDKVLITRVLSMAGTRPPTVLLAFMGVSCFASMWISNVAAPTLCFTLIRPILRTLPPKSAFAPCLILAIALAANIGGQSSPISSPQNLIALQAMDPPVDWASWFAVALPVSAISIVLIWLLLLVSYRPSRMPDQMSAIDPDWDGAYRELEIKPIRPTKERFTMKQYWVTFVCLVTIGLWCVAHEIQEYVGDMGIIAIIPIIAFFGTGVLKKDDFEHFAWSIVFLAMGGIALGKGVVASGLLEVMDVFIRDMVQGFSLYTVVLILTPIVLIISTFISHTIASVLLVPIAKEVGSNLPGGHSNLLIFITGLICSTGMGMPVSGFPNQTAATQEDELGENYLTNVDFLKNGVPASMMAALVVSTVGFALMRLIGL